MGSSFNNIYSSGSGNATNGYKKTATSTKTDILQLSELNKILHSNGYFSRQSISNNLTTKFNRFGYSNPYNIASPNREYLFFTKPDLNIFGEDEDLTVNSDKLELNSKLKTASLLFGYADKNYRPILKQLQYHADMSTPFMCSLSNCVTSSLELPGISAEQIESSANLYGTSIAYRSHSYKSDQAHSFTLSFCDSKYLEIYMLAKLYDEYHTLLKLGRIQPKEAYIINRILDDQFSIYKFVVSAEDGETILYFAKETGVFIQDVPRSDLGEFPQDGVKFSLSFYSQFVEDLNPYIISEFNRISPISGMTQVSTYDTSYGVNNEWVKRPHVIKGTSTTKKNDGCGEEVFKLKWYN